MFLDVGLKGRLDPHNENPVVAAAVVVNPHDENKRSGDGQSAP